MNKLPTYLGLGAIAATTMFTSCKDEPYQTRRPSITIENMPQANGYDVRIAYKLPCPRIHIGTLNENGRFNEYVLASDGNDDGRFEEINIMTNAGDPLEKMASLEKIKKIWTAATLKYNTENPDNLQKVYWE